MPKEIKVKLTSSSVEAAIAELKAYKAKVKLFSKRLCEKLAEIGATEITLGFAHAIYNGERDHQVSVSQDGMGYRVVVGGESAVFMEYGSGVAYGQGYPGEKPSGISAIGTYGKGKGSQNSWMYYGNPSDGGQFVKSTDKGDLMKTHGNPPNAVIYRTARALSEDVARIAKEVFTSL